MSHSTALLNKLLSAMSTRDGWRLSTEGDKWVLQQYDCPEYSCETLNDADMAEMFAIVRYE